MIIGVRDSSSFPIAHCNLHSHLLPFWSSKIFTQLAALLWFGMLLWKWWCFYGGASSLCAFLLPDQRAHCESSGETVEARGKRQKSNGWVLQNEAIMEEWCMIVWENHSTTVFWCSAFRIGLWISQTVAVMAVLDEGFFCRWSKVGPANSASQCAKGMTEDPTWKYISACFLALDNASAVVALMDFK